jgi:hypothetical protein
MSRPKPKSPRWFWTHRLRVTPDRTVKQPVPDRRFRTRAIGLLGLPDRHGWQQFTLVSISITAESRSEVATVLRHARRLAEATKEVWE